MLLLPLLVFVSGACALIYQLLWLRLLGLVFGVTVHAASTVLASFMAGLAIGSYAAGRLAPRARRPLLWFAAAEALIGISAAGTPLVLQALQALYAGVYGSLPESLALVTAARFVMAFATLVVPTALMGATLPLLMKSGLAKSAGVGRLFGTLYAVNTAGAITGTLTAGFFFVPALGLQRTFLVAAAANLLVAVVAWLVGRQQVVTSEPQADGGAAAGTAPISRGAQWAVLWVFALSGFTSLALEVVWFRVNILVLRPTVYAFAMMLATILGGIALGSAAVAPFLGRSRAWLTVLAALEFLVAVAGLATFKGLEIAPRAIEWATPFLGFLPPYLVPLVVTSVITIFPSMFLMGAAFPIGLQLWTGAGAGPATAPGRIGIFYSLNVLGAIAGSIVAGFVFLPWLGSQGTLLLLTALTAASALVLLAVNTGARVAVRGAVAAAGLALLFVVPVPDPFAVFLAQRYPDQPIIWKQEGIQTTVSIHALGQGERQRRVMYLDGLHQASTAGSLVPVHRRKGVIGLAMHPDARDVLVIGLGGGATAGAAAQYQRATVDVVELSGEVVQGAAFFSGINYDVLNRPNVRLRVDDGRNHLLLSGKKYDVITADIIQPIHAGSGNVYSSEYFDLVRSGLRGSGVAIQWVFGTEAEYKMIMRTFLAKFPHATLWADGSIMVGTRRPLKLFREEFEQKLKIAEYRGALDAAGIRSFDDLLGLYTAGPDEMRRFVGRGPILTDDRPMVEYFLSLPREPLDISSLRGNVRTVLP